MQDERLIECVRRREFLYNFSHPKYGDAKYKSMAWREISDELNQTTMKCKKRWQNIRDLFRKYRAKDAVQSRQAEGSSYRKYRHWEALQFLAPHLHEKDLFYSTKSAQNLENRPKEGSEHRSESDETDETSIEFSVPDEGDMQSPPVENSAPSTNEKARLFLEKAVADCDRLLRGISERKTHSSGEALSANHTALEKYFLGIAASVAQLKKKHQSLVKLQLAEIVAEFEQKEYEEEEKADA
ncbi:uncharacterized protein LOC143359439 [Halictus rubicundus]|uniref:uncharacterized protein LOC143359439 n=1 Tax=Halictus rubicundus TaxID=77578 RepID=UPI0040373DE6